MKDNNIKISVITVCYNSVDTIEDTMLSVLNQTYDNIEYIIIDGGSSDGTLDIIKKYSDRVAYWISEPDNGIFDAMNKGILAATGVYVNFMNAGDCFSDLYVIEKLVSNIESDTTIAYGDWNIVSKGISYLRKPLNFKYIKRQIPFCHQACFIDTNYHKKHMFPDNYNIIGDYKIVYDAYKNSKTKFQYVPICIVNYDITLGNSVSIDSYKNSMYEKYDLWGIKNSYIKRIPYEIEIIMTSISYEIKKRLPTKHIMFIKNIKNFFRYHRQ